MDRIEELAMIAAVNLNSKNALLQDDEAFDETCRVFKRVLRMAVEGAAVDEVRAALKDGGDEMSEAFRRVFYKGDGA